MLEPAPCPRAGVLMREEWGLQITAASSITDTRQVFGLVFTPVDEFGTSTVLLRSFDVRGGAAGRRDGMGVIAQL